MITPLFPALPYASANFAIDSATDALGAIFVAQKSGTIDRLFYNCNANTSPPSYLIRLESLSAGRPSNTILSAGASATFTPANTNVNAVALGTSYNVTAGEVYGIAVIGDRPADVFRVSEATPTTTTIEILNCGPEVSDKAATLARVQEWANFVWRLP